MKERKERYAENFFDRIIKIHFSIKIIDKIIEKFIETFHTVQEISLRLRSWKWTPLVDDTDDEE